MVRRNELRVATILALLITLGGVVLSGESSLGLWAAVAWNVVGFAAVLLGGEVGRRRNRALVSENSAAASTQ